jgi:2-keto-4-pentenoate hydratase/2-oxohepta-3-ene-1,7-dioic acid hydratase in catechol pathway
MKFVTFSERGFARAGVLLGDGTGGTDQIVDLAHPSMREAMRGAPPQMRALIKAGLPGVVQDIRARLAEAATLPLSAATLMAPLLEPRRIFGIAHNYRDALVERGMAPPEKPVLFMKAPRTIAGPGQAIFCRQRSAGSPTRPNLPP